MNSRTESGHPLRSHREAVTDYFDARTRCPACGAVASRQLARIPYSEPELSAFLHRYYRHMGAGAAKLVGAEFVVDECLSCTLAYQRYVPSAAFLDEIYNDWLRSDYRPDADPVVARTLRAPRWSRDGVELVTAAAFLARPVSSLAVLDYGMGWALWARVAVRLGCRAYGFDLSRERTAFASSQGITCVSEADLAGLQLDFVNTEQVLEHLVDPAATVHLLAGALRSGGLLKISVPRAPQLARRLVRPDWNASRGSSGWLIPIHPLEHVNCFTPRALEVMARSAGLEPVTIPLGASYAFMRTSPIALVGAPLRQAGKELLRPAWRAWSRTNLYRWFRKAS